MQAHEGQGQERRIPQQGGEKEDSCGKGQKTEQRDAAVRVDVGREVRAVNGLHLNNGLGHGGKNKGVLHCRGQTAEISAAVDIGGKGTLHGR